MKVDENSLEINYRLRLARALGNKTLVIVYVIIYDWTIVSKATTIHRTDDVRKSFFYSGAVLWNSLSTNIRVSKTLGEFKTKLSHFS